MVYSKMTNNHFLIASMTENLEVTYWDNKVKGGLGQLA